MVFGDGAGFDGSWLDPTPFTSYLWPGVILAVVVGGTQVLAVIAQLRLILPGVGAARRRRPCDADLDLRGAGDDDGVVRPAGGHVRHRDAAGRACRPVRAWPRR